MDIAIRSREMPWNHRISSIHLNSRHFRASSMKKKIIPMRHDRALLSVIQLATVSVSTQAICSIFDSRPLSTQCVVPYPSPLMAIRYTLPRVAQSSWCPSRAKTSPCENTPSASWSSMPTNIPIQKLLPSLFSLDNMRYENVSVSYGERTVLRDINVEIRP